MHLDVVEMRHFYYRTGLGRAVQRVIRSQLMQIWPDAAHETVAGFGFATPLLRPYLTQARRVIALMPAPQGVMHWPPKMPNISVLTDEQNWPLQTGFVDKLVMMHGLETSELPNALLAEAWRVLGPGGRAVFIVPNRAGLWSRSEATPFGYGRPYTMGQLETQLRIAGFDIVSHRTALFQPPSTRRFWLKSGRLWEKVGRRLGGAFVGGVVMVEASKQVFARPSGGTPETLRRRPSVLGGLGGTPAPKTAIGRFPRIGGDKPN